MSNHVTSKDAIVIERTFDTSVDVVWQMWTQPDIFKMWYGPEGFTLSIVEMDVRIGGKHLFCMEQQTPEGSMKMWLTGEYTEIVPNQRLSYTDSMADENGRILSPAEFGMPDDYPVITEVRVSLQDIGGRTKMVMTHAGVSPTEEGASAGWEQALDKLAAQIETVLKSK